MKEIEPGIFENQTLYQLSNDDGDDFVYYSNELAILRAFAKRRGYAAEESWKLLHRSSRDELSLLPGGGAPASALQPGSNIWYRPLDEIRRVIEGVVQYFCYVDLKWDIYDHDELSHLLELEFQEVSIDFLFSQEVRLPTYNVLEYGPAVINALI